MGQLRVQIDNRTEVRVKDNVAMPDGWHLWMSMWRDGAMIATTADEDVVVPDIDDATLTAAAHNFARGFEARDVT